MGQTVDIDSAAIYPMAQALGSAVAKKLLVDLIDGLIVGINSGDDRLAGIALDLATRLRDIRVEEFCELAVTDLDFSARDELSRRGKRIVEIDRLCRSLQQRKEDEP